MKAMCFHKLKSALLNGYGEFTFFVSRKTDLKKIANTTISIWGLNI